MLRQRIRVKKSGWFSHKCVEVIKRRNKYRMKWLRTRNMEDYESYKVVRKKGVKTIFNKSNQKLDWE